MDTNIVICKTWNFIIARVSHEEVGISLLFDNELPLSHPVQLCLSLGLSQNLVDVVLHTGCKVLDILDLCMCLVDMRGDAIVRSVVHLLLYIFNKF